MTRILMVRHGQSEWNAQGRWQGQADPPLSDLGRHQAFSAAQRVGSVDAIVASDLQRALHTARIISEQIGVGPVIIEPLLRERDAGEWSGLTREQIDEQYPGYLDERKRPDTVEADESVRTRTIEALANVEREYRGGEVLVIAHGDNRRLNSATRITIGTANDSTGRIQRVRLSPALNQTIISESR